MSSKTITLGLTSALTVALAVMVMPRVSAAQSCGTDADCAKGMTCKESSVAPTPTARPTCPKEVACDISLVAPTPTPVQNDKSCQAAACVADADCGTGMVCHSETVKACSGGSAPACPANTICDAVLPIAPTCTETKTSLCTYTWQLPCMLDADCGAAFVCTPVTSGTCSGGSGVAPSAGGGGTGTGSGGSAASDPARPAIAIVAPDAIPGGSSDGGTTTCTTTTTFPGSCQPKSITCAADTDCPATWTCVTSPIAVSGGATPVDTGSSGSTAPTPATGVAIAPSPLAPLPPAAKICQPPGAFPVRGVATDLGGDGATPTVGGNKGGGTGSLPPAEATSSSNNAGCAVAGANPPLGAGLLGSVLLGLLVSGLLGVRRRATRRGH